MKKILTFGGSNSKNSINKVLAVYVAGQIENVELQIADLNDYELPLYSTDFEAKKGIPQAAVDFGQLIKEADGIVLSLAEHNGLPTAAFKNLFDWLSRIDQNVWKNKPMLLMATSPGGRGGAGALRVMKEVFPYFGARVVTDYSLPSFYNNFYEDGIKEQTLKSDLEEKIRLFEAGLTEEEKVLENIQM